MSVSVFSVDGVQHRRYFFNSSIEMDAFSFDITDLQSGVYFIEINNSTGSGINRIVLEK